MTNASELWDREYLRAGIPSSTRAAPTRALVDFLDGEFGHGLSGRALDLGCGGGRNAFHLAERGFETIGFDYSESQISALTDRLARAPMPQLRFALQDVSTPWPLADRSIDLAVDVFCFKHLIQLEALSRYASELTRCLAVGGRFFLSFATRTDGYYSRFAAPEQSGPGVIITDPGNDIRSRLYDVGEILSIFGALTVLRSIVRPGRNAMHGERYERESAIIYFEQR
jgi:SAM-dependent methyltransferase